MNMIPLDEKWLEPMCELWNEELGDHFPMREQLMRQNTFQDENVYLDGSKLAVSEDGELIGFVIAKKWQEQQREMRLGDGGGWIQAILVRSDARGQGIGSSLLEQAERALRDAGAELAYIGRDPWHYIPGIPKALPDAKAWFERKGYEVLYEVFDLVNQTSKENGQRQEYVEGAYSRLLEEKDKEEMLRFFKRCFPGRWYYEAQCYWERGGQGREFMGLFAGDEMIGFCRVNDAESPLIAQNTYWAPLFDSPLGGIGPLGVDDRFRGKGYGLAIVKDGVAELTNRGMKHLVIDWTELVDFYAKLGFSVWKGYDLAKKTL
ncbi:acetyltransferase [Paenibacillus sp. J23TS9]|uniref:GNAT family N-acetyltransferase n=1 Tax=Paenibacillus sp. J23TS9 TaxID=2807193 RepID=UPI001B06F02F|nr:GNAT family N-acetyltransferase [Paenibacillus sp. J23TS9]GIP27410.1 acetyltransferase [Paenibacillus sp. J23TS9]